MRSLTGAAQPGMPSPTRSAAYVASALIPGSWANPHPHNYNLQDFPGFVLSISARDHEISRSKSNRGSFGRCMLTIASPILGALDCTSDIMLPPIVCFDFMEQQKAEPEIRPKCQRSPDRIPKKLNRGCC